MTTHLCRLSIGREKPKVPLLVCRALSAARPTFLKSSFPICCSIAMMSFMAAYPTWIAFGNYGGGRRITFCWTWRRCPGAPKRGPRTLAICETVEIL